MKFLRALISVILTAALCYAPLAPASNVGPGLGAAGIVTSPVSIFGSTTTTGVIATLSKPEAGVWTVTISNNTSGAGTVVIQMLMADNATWLTMTVFNGQQGTITIGTAGVVTFVAATLQTLSYQFTGPILSLRVNVLTNTAATIYATISAN